MTLRHRVSDSRRFERFETPEDEGYTYFRSVEIRAPSDAASHTQKTGIHNLFNALPLLGIEPPFLSLPARRQAISVTLCCLLSKTAMLLLMSRRLFVLYIAF